MDTVKILNIDIHNWTFDGFLAQLEKGVVVTPNVDHMMKLQKDHAFYKSYMNAEHIVCDSRIIQLASRMLFPQPPIAEQIAGSDLFPAYCQYHKDNTDKVRVFLLGGTETSVKQAQENINARAGAEVVIDGYSPPFGFEKDENETQAIIERITASGANVLAVGVGAPKQELWIDAHRHKLPSVDLFFAIGATIDFQAGAVQRAPRWMVKFGLEWLHRMLQEPGRMVKRYLVDDLPFFWLMIKQKFGRYQNPWNTVSETSVANSDKHEQA